MTTPIPERLLRRTDIATMLNTTPGVAATILAKWGVHPIDFGRGAGRGPRWLESAVRGAMQQMHEAAQPKARQPRQQRLGVPHIKLADMSVDEIYRLTTGQGVQ